MKVTLIICCLVIGFFVGRFTIEKTETKFVKGETIRDYRRTLFDNESGKLSVDLSVQYNELQRLAYSFAPIHKEVTTEKQRVFVPFVSVTSVNWNSLSVGGGFFYYDVGVRVEFAVKRVNFGLLYKF